VTALSPQAFVAKWRDVTLKENPLGAHYTSKEDILLIVQPVLMAPLRRRWADAQAQARKAKTRAARAPQIR
jgi:hypothetical protein